MRKIKVLGKILQVGGEPVQFAAIGAPPRRQSYHPKPRGTDISEVGWGRVKRHFPTPELGPRNRRTPIRALLNATLFRLSNNVPLRQVQAIAPDFPPWGSLHSFEHRVAEAGLWPRILMEAGRQDLLPALEKMIHIVRYHEDAGPNAKVDIRGLMTEEA